MPRKASSRPAASSLDMEDLIKYEGGVNAISCNVKTVSTYHESTRHEFKSHELLTTRTELLDWYDMHRRKLPWRGDPPPYVTTAIHTSQKKTNKNDDAGKQTGLDAFLKVLVKEEPEQESEQEQDDNKNEAAANNVRKATAMKVKPYETWVSEIMLQQTRVDTVVEYFLRWIDKFPTVAALAKSNEEDVNAMWAGLGYYRRARMLHAGAKYVMKKYNGELPSTVDQLLTIPGIGPYTAGAIASIAFDQREPLVDGNVIRVMARMRAVGADPKNKQLIKFSWKAASELVSGCDRPGALNQALMELGATVCTVQNPQCSDCPVKSVCLALEKTSAAKLKSKCSTVSQASAEACSICDYTRVTEWDETQTEVTKYPLKAKKNDARQEVICVTVVSSPADDIIPRKRKAAKSIEDSSPSDWKFLMVKRSKEGLLAGQWEFLHTKMSDGDQIPPFSKRKTFMDTQLTDILGTSAFSQSSRLIMERHDIGELTHIFSHVKHHMGIEHLHFHSTPDVIPRVFKSDNMRWITMDEMEQLGITTGVKKILQLILDHKNKQRTRRRGCVVSHVTYHEKRPKTIASYFNKL